MKTYPNGAHMNWTSEKGFNRSNDWKNNRDRQDHKFEFQPDDQKQKKNKKTPTRWQSIEQSHTIGGGMRWANVWVCIGNDLAVIIWSAFAGWCFVCCFFIVVVVAIIICLACD